MPNERASAGILKDRRVRRVIDTAASRNRWVRSLCFDFCRCYYNPDCYRERASFATSLLPL
ncbi:MAG: hypothetical protein N3B10_09415 [Armatimonadetes bacterium]|nr:hypothetical protein [Armatimonadota bacterium]